MDYCHYDYLIAIVVHAHVVVYLSPISDPVVVPNGSEFDGGDNDGVGSKNGGCSADKAIAFGMSNNDDPELNMGEDMAIAMITKVNAE